MAPATHAGSEARALTLWERAVGLDRWRRDEELLRALHNIGGSGPEALGARNAALLEVRGLVFGRSWPLRSRCPECGTELGFAVDSVALAQELSGMSSPPATCTIAREGHTLKLRAPTAGDLIAVADQTDRRSAARALLARCLDGLEPTALDDAELEELGRRIEALDPAGVVSFALTCPDCGDSWSAAVDVGEAIWSELRLTAERIVIEIDALARAYGWTEDEVLGLSPARRAAYLQLLGAS